MVLYTAIAESQELCMVNDLLNFLMMVTSSGVIESDQHITGWALVSHLNGNNVHWVYTYVL